MSTVTRETSALARAITEPLATGEEWTLDRSYESCDQLARSHYENFPVGSLLIPKRLRKHVCAIYAFARIADDFADEGYEGEHSEAERLALIEKWRLMLRQSLDGSAAHPVFVALRHTQTEFDLPLSLFEDLLSAFAQDVTIRRYESFEQLLDYCRRSANPIGRLVLLLFGYRDEQRLLWSDQICSALQLANHWQDVAVDLQKDRVYIPLEDLRRFNMTADDLAERQATAPFKRLMRFQVERAREMFSRGKPLCMSVPGRLGLELRATWLGGMRILERIEEDGYDVFTRRPIITGSDKLAILFRAMSKEAFRRS